jgi:hypothetical protein
MEFPELLFLRTFAALRCVFHRFSESPADAGVVVPHTLLSTVLNLFDTKGLLHFDRWSVDSLRLAIVGTRAHSPFRQRIQTILENSQDTAALVSDFAGLFRDWLVPLIHLQRTAGVLQDTQAEQICTLALERVHQNLRKFISMLLCVPVNSDITSRLHSSISTTKYYSPWTIRSLANQAVLQLVYRSPPVPPEQFHRTLVDHCLRPLAITQRDADFAVFLNAAAADESERLFLAAVHHVAIPDRDRRRLLALVYGGMPLETFFPEVDNAESHARREDLALVDLNHAFRKISNRI